jgi:ProP effector
MTDNSEKPQPRRNAALQTLTEAFPVIRNCQPLAIGIHKTIKARLPDLGEGALRFALKQHTASTKYLKAISSGSQRFDLDGNPAGEITAEQRQQALDALKERFRKGAERKRQEQQQKEHQEKLLKLAEKFNRR